MLDVGQGDSILVQGRDAAILVDAGVALPEGVDRGRDVVLPALRALGVARLDRLVVTHADLDHRGGVPAVLSGVPVGSVWVPRGALADPLFAPVLAAARALGVPVEERGLPADDEVVGDLVLRSLWPPAPAARSSSNDRSLVLQVEVAGRRILLPGDLEAQGEQQLLARGLDLRSELLVVAHHGSRTSSSEPFLAAVSPQLALVSAPCLGRFQMPHATVVSRLARRGIPLHWTGRDGALRVGLASSLRVLGTGARRPHCGAALRRDAH